MRSTRAIGVTATLLAVLAGAGCSGGASHGGASATSSHPSNSTATKPPASQTSTVSMSPTSTALATKSPPSSNDTAAGAPGVPEAARQHTDAGAKAFVDYFFERSNELFRDPRKGNTEALALASCRPCSDNSVGLKAMAAKKRHYDRDQVQYRITRVLNVGPNSTNVFADLKQNPARLIDASGNVISITPTPRVKAVALLSWLPEKGWRVRDLSHE